MSGKRFRSGALSLRVLQMYNFLRQSCLRKRKYRVAGPPRRKTYIFKSVLDFPESEADVQQCGLF